GRRALLGRQPPELLQPIGEKALLAEVLDAYGVELLQIPGRASLRLRITQQFLESAHARPLNVRATRQRALLWPPPRVPQSLARRERRYRRVLFDRLRSRRDADRSRAGCTTAHWPVPPH